MRHLKTFENKEDNLYQKMVKINFIGNTLIPFEDIENMDAYQNAINRNEHENALFYGVEQYLSENPDYINYNYSLVDGNENPIDDEEEFDERVKLYKAGKKYNI